jgi:hypothetical protein
MAKKQTFMDKMKKSHLSGPICPTCGEPISMVRVVEAVSHEGSSTRFHRRLAKLCKCNQKEIMGA